MEWHDPFEEDEASRERERRRAEREARRRERQQSLAKKVGAQGGDVEPKPSPESTPAAQQPAASPRTSTPTGRALMARRIFGVGAVVVAVLLVYFGAKAVKGVLDGGDDSAPAAPKPPKEQELLIPEGLDRHQIAELAKDEGLKGDYERASQEFKGFKPAKYGADGAPNLEGFLFPATYRLPKKGTVKDLVARQLDAFRANLSEVDLSYAKSKNLNVYDVLKIASMIEREIQVPDERRLAAAVIYNRLAGQTPLGIDATIRYEDQNYDEQLLESRLSTDTPYNTRTHAGLPPTPIGNPGLASIEAAANPAKSDVFFFVVKPGSCGEHVFVETQAEFDEAEAAYQQALAEQGGSPTDC